MKKKISEKSERIVIDEIFDNGTTRLLRSRHLPDSGENDYSIKAWDEEQEAFIDTWRIEAFVGFPSKQSLREGDVFYIVDGTLLNDAYRPVPRDHARETHLLISWEESTRFARLEIKKQFYKLSVTRMAQKTNERNQMLKRVDQKFEKDLPVSGQGGEI